MKNINICLFAILILLIILFFGKNRERFIEMKNLIFKNGQVTDGRWNKYIDKILFKEYAKSKGVKAFPTIAIFDNPKKNKNE